MELEKQIYQKIIAANNILLVTHYNPDGDALSSLSVFIDLMISFGKDYQAYCRSIIDKAWDYLPHMEKITHEINPADWSQFDLIISLDCGSVERTGIADLILQRNEEQLFIEIDHHPKVESVSNLEYRHPDASATAELVYNFCDFNQIKITPDMASSILTGLAADTGGFIYPSTTRSAIGIAAAMLWRGARLPAVIKQTFQGQSLSSMKIWGLAMSRLVVNPKYQVAYTVLTQQDYQDLNATEAMTDELAGWLACLDGVKAVLFLKESKPGLIKGSWRSADNSIDVGKLSRIMGGGGHSKAAGFALGGEIIKTEIGWQIK